ncbi:hypothetical protein ACIA49_39190 [Kribbella sp. NPDC051587]|uniref:hypothetical protein n=1 Tax=Kribbella sp. NPDC051587 TaxID=3364119 RepID=UPI003797410E
MTTSARLTGTTGRWAADRAARNEDLAAETYLREETARRVAQADEWGIAMLPIEDHLDQVWHLARETDDAERAVQYEQLAADMVDAARSIVTLLRFGLVTLDDIPSELKRWHAVSQCYARELGDGGTAAAALAAPITARTADEDGQPRYADGAVWRPEADR